MVYLSPREREVLKLVAEGQTNRQIAIMLNLSEHTVKNYMRAIRNKFGTESRTEAVAVALRAGLI